jgi:hypothetical protein
MHDRLVQCPSFWTITYRPERLTRWFFPRSILQKPFELQAPNPTALGWIAARYISAMQQNRHSLFVQGANSTMDRQAFERERLAATLLEPVGAVLAKLHDHDEARLAVWTALRTTLPALSASWDSLALAEDAASSLATLGNASTHAWSIKSILLGISDVAVAEQKPLLVQVSQGGVLG